MSMTPEPLAACPFCGGTHILDDYIRDGRRLVCADCSGSVHAFQPNASQRCAEKWNRRTPKAAEPEAGEVADPTPIEWLVTVRNGQHWTDWQLIRFDEAIAALRSLASVKADRDHFNEQLQSVNYEYGRLQRKLTAARAQVEKMREHVRHSGECASRVPYIPPRGFHKRPCDCGASAALTPSDDSHDKTQS